MLFWSVLPQELGPGAYESFGECCVASKSSPWVSGLYQWATTSEINLLYLHFGTSICLKISAQGLSEGLSATPSSLGFMSHRDLCANDGA